MASTIHPEQSEKISHIIVDVDIIQPTKTIGKKSKGKNKNIVNPTAGIVYRNFKFSNIFMVASIL
ncbi:MAG: hypothetical protein UU81_C0006G0021 [Microgenomates group bacterium GW2011_GWC1_41_8]|uniref:Uncharacterized protein n=1 Tax=Candidatus Roizmanbacteria bacterium GW2011_GWB1_40_7 TaxID=1618482 RepID=A0A0G0VLS1_9BACT|nr:MAG: hypothetical protein UU14_C0002G0083 [Candidatus Roizmanbacteria bacterium GW2011_GWB1_40_7]KKS24505.1 MAG: hypothetical protein UU81_C0006G0021 [Microgenomates group bacterium GW2011_GWC1_41_8]